MHCDIVVVVAVTHRWLYSVTEVIKLGSYFHSVYINDFEFLHFHPHMLGVEVATTCS